MRSTAAKTNRATRPDLVPVAVGFDFVECPRYTAEGVYFASRTHIHRASPGDKIETIAARSVGGILFHKSGGVVLSGRNVVHLKGGASTEIFGFDQGVECNDLYADSSGRILAGTVPIHEDGSWNTGATGHLWRIDSIGHAACLQGGVGFSNGIGTSPDGRYVYQSDTFARRIIRYELDDVRVAARQVISTASVDGYPDGLAIDTDGNLWVAMFEGGIVAQLTHDGSLIAAIELPSPKVTSVSFGGADLTDLYVSVCSAPDEPGTGGIFRVGTGGAVGLGVPFVEV